MEKVGIIFTYKEIFKISSNRASFRNFRGRVQYLLLRKRQNKGQTNILIFCPIVHIFLLGFFHKIRTDALFLCTQRKYFHDFRAKSSITH